MSDSPMRLPLHSFEHYMLADSRPSHPMTFFLKFEIAEELARSRLNAAIKQCCRFHPLLTATINRRWPADWGRWRWNFSGMLPNLDAHQPNLYTQSRSDWSFDLSREGCLRISMAGSPDGGTELWFQIHHVGSDAKGILQFVRDLQSAYHQPFTESEVQQREMTAARTLASRTASRGSRLSSYLNPAGPKWMRIWKYYFHRTRPLHPSSPRPEDSFNLKAEVFSPALQTSRVPFQNETWQELRKELNVPATLNDCMLQALFHSMADHQKRNFPNVRDHWIRIGVPIDMRSEQHSPLFACNCSSLVFLDQRVDRIRKGVDVLTEVHREMRHVKQHRLGSVLLDCLGFLHCIPAAMWLVANDMRCAVSVAASNLGAVEFPDVEGFSIRKIDFYPPLRPGTSMSLGMSTYNGQLNLSLNFDRRLISTADANTLLEQLSTSMS